MKTRLTEFWNATRTLMISVSCFESKFAKVQIRHDLQIVGERAQFRGGAELQPGSFVEIYGMVERVLLDAENVSVLGLLIEIHAVDDRFEIPALQQAGLQEPRLTGELRIAEIAEEPGHFALRGGIERRDDVEVQAVQLVEILETE